MGYVAFKPYSLCPPGIRPLGIPEDYPWVSALIDAEQVATYSASGHVVLSDADYADYLANLEDARIAGEAAAPKLAVHAVVTAATQFGAGLMAEFAAENVLLGITQDGKTGDVLNTLSGVMDAALSGSLYEAIARIRLIDPANYDTKYITAARLLAFVNKVETYLGLPLSESL